MRHGIHDPGERAGASQPAPASIIGSGFLVSVPLLASAVGYLGGRGHAWAFGALGTQDRARHLATLYLNDLADVLRDAVARDNPHCLDQLKAEAPGEPGEPVVLLHFKQRFEQSRDLAVDEMLEPAGDLVGHFDTRFVVDKG
ncbi:MAG TPA: hypothetical protein PK510_06570, partial [Ottowia sp.]|nr:hypothetical protein [Ottowia sp.]